MPRTSAPEHVPAHIRDHQLVIAACRARDLGKVLKLIQNLSDGEFTDSHLGRRCGLTPSRVAEYMAGRIRARDNAVFERAADGLHIPGARFGLPPRDWEATPLEGAVMARDAAPAFTQERVDPLPASLIYSSSVPTTLSTVKELGRADMLRRGFLQSAGYVVAAMAASSRDWLLSSLDELDSGRARRVSHDDVAAIRAVFAEFQRADVIGGGGDEVRRAVAAYLADYVMPVVREPQAPDVQEALYEVAAEQTYLAGWLAFDGGLHGLAQRYLVQSLQLAQASGNRILGSHVLAGMSDQATQLGYPEEGRSLAQAGLHVLLGLCAPAAMTDLFTLEIRSHAALGDTRAAVHAIDEAEQWFARIDLADEPQWAQFIDEGYIMGELANSLRDLGDGGEAERFATVSIAACRRQGRARRASLSYAALAASHVQRRDVEAAVDAAGRALELAAAVPSIRCTAALDGVRDRLAPHAGSAPVDEFMDRLAASRAA